MKTQSEYCRLCRRPLEEWEVGGICEGCASLDNQQAGRLRSPVNAGRQDAGPERITLRITGHERKDYEFRKHVDECSRACGCYARHSRRKHSADRTP